jgi:hypothetical protein
MTLVGSDTLHGHSGGLKVLGIMSATYKMSPMLLCSAPPSHQQQRNTCFPDFELGIRDSRDPK